MLADLIGHRLSGRSGGLYRRLADEIAALIGSAELSVGARLSANRSRTCTARTADLASRSVTLSTNVVPLSHPTRG